MMLRNWRKCTTDLWARNRQLIGILGTAAVVLAVVTPVQAQQMMVPAAPPHDRVRVSGFLWRGNVTGVLNLESLQNIPGFANGVGVSSTLGLDKKSNGFVLEANFAAARRHRFIVVYSGIEHKGEQSIEIPLPGADLIIGADTVVKLREFHAFYNFVYASNSQVEAGVLGGMGYFDIKAAVTSNFGAGAGVLDQAFPSIGANLLIAPQARARGYIEMTGFPRVTVDDLSGYQMELVARAEVFITRELAGVVGYRRYRLNVDDELTGVGVDVTWHGLLFGVEIRY